MATRPMSPYAASKLATEAYTNAYHHSYGLATLALRFFNVFGPRQAAGHAYAAVVPASLVMWPPSASISEEKCQPPLLPAL